MTCPGRQGGAGKSSGAVNVFSETENVTLGQGLNPVNGSTQTSSSDKRSIATHYNSVKLARSGQKRESNIEYDNEKGLSAAASDNLVSWHNRQDSSRKQEYHKTV